MLYVIFKIIHFSHSVPRDSRDFHRYLLHSTMKLIFIHFLLFFVVEQITAESLLSLIQDTDCDIERERTFIMIKPDGVQRGLIGEIINRFERKGFKLVAMKFLKVNPTNFSFKLL